MTDIMNEHEAALLEGIAPMPEDLIALREESIALKEEIDRLTERRNKIKDTFGERLDSEGLKGYVLYGKVHARVTHGTRTDVDKKKLKEDMPHIYKRFLKVTSYRSVTVN